MAEASIYARVLSLVAGISGETALAPTSGLKQDLGLDSIEIVQLVMDLNHRFGITIHSAEIAPAHFDTLGQLADFVERKLQEASHGTGT